MTSQESLDFREVIFINQRCLVDYEALPGDVREGADQAIDALQNAHPVSPKLFRVLHGKLSGVGEIRLPYDSDTYRVYVTLRCPWIVMILDAGLKKSTEGKNIPRWQEERLKTRHKRAQEYWTDHNSTLRAAYDKRQERRDALLRGRST